MKDFLWKKKFLYVVLAALVSDSVAGPAISEFRGLIADHRPLRSLAKKESRPSRYILWCEAKGDELFRRLEQRGRSIYGRSGRRGQYPEVFGGAQRPERFFCNCCRFLRTTKDYEEFEGVMKAECRKLGGHWYRTITWRSYGGEFFKRKAKVCSFN